MTWTEADATHLLRRTGLGTSRDQVTAAYVAGKDATLDRLLNYEAIPDPVWDDPNPLGFTEYLTSELDAQRNLLYKLLVSSRPLHARLLWFWHSHFTTSMSVTSIRLMERQLRTWRQRATGKFGDFLNAMYVDGAMLQYLDGAGNTKTLPNENFARENFELFTLGPGNFTESDVREAARAFTGWTVGSDGTVKYDATLHDDGMKTVLGSTGNLGGAQVMGLLANHNDTVHRICRKLYSHFISTDVDLFELNVLLNAWLSSDGDLKQVMRTLLNLPGFWAAKNRAVLLKSPLEFSFGLVRQLDLGMGWALVDQLVRTLPQQGANPWYPGNPSGYPSGARLAGSSQLIARYRFAYHCVYERGATTLAEKLLTDVPKGATREQLVASVASRLGMRSLSKYTLQSIYDYLGTAPLSKEDLPAMARTTAYLIACSPEYQLA